MTVIITVAAAMLAVAAALTLWRIVAGPTPLDRIIAADVLVGVVIASVGITAALSGTATGLPILLGLSLIGFTGAVGVARLIASPTAVRRVFDRRQALREEDSDDR
ncbi:MAG: monovalent cation/H+ antiporter complex subunit F [Propionicimonas sp.]